MTSKENQRDWWLEFFRSTESFVTALELIVFRFIALGATIYMLIKIVVTK